MKRRWLLPLCVCLALASACDGSTLNVLDGPGACVSSGVVAGLQARATDDFVNSFGVKPLGLPLSDARVAEALTELGARHIVLSHWDNNDAPLALARALDLTGLVSTERPAEAVAALSFYGDRAEAVCFRDNSPVVDAAWGARIRAQQKQMFEAVKANASTRDIIVAGPNVQSDEQIAAAGDLTEWVDVGTFFPWTSELWRDPPGIRAETDLARHVPVYGALPLIAPQTGYDTSSAAGVTVGVQAKYVVRMLLEHFRLGVPRTYVADLADSVPGLEGGPSEGLGLLYSDGSPKPAFEALARTMALLADPGPRFVPGRLAFTVSPALPNVHQLLLQKRNGLFYLLLWREVPSVDADVSEAVVINLESPAKGMTLFSPVYGATPLQQGQGRSIAVNVPDSLAVVVIESACP